MCLCVTDKAEASTLPTYGQRESSAGCSLPLSHLPAHQKEAPVSPHMHAAVEGGRAPRQLFVTALRVVLCRVDTEEWMATVEVLLSKSSEACQWMVQYLVSPEGREITRFASLMCGSIRDLGHLFKSQVYYSHT